MFIWNICQFNYYILNSTSQFSNAFTRALKLRDDGYIFFLNYILDEVIAIAHLCAMKTLQKW